MPPTDQSPETAARHSVLCWIVHNRLGTPVAAFLTLSDAVDYGKSQGRGLYICIRGRRAPGGFDFNTIHAWEYRPSKSEAA